MLSEGVVNPFRAAHVFQDAPVFKDRTLLELFFDGKSSMEKIAEYCTGEKNHDACLAATISALEHLVMIQQKMNRGKTKHVLKHQFSDTLDEVSYAIIQMLSYLNSVSTYVSSNLSMVVYRNNP